MNMGAEFYTGLNGKSSRAADRRHAPLAVKVRRPSQGWFKSRIADLSVAGFCLQSFMKLKEGDVFWIMLPGFEGRRAQVLWTRGHEAGCQFERPLHPAILDHVVRTSR